MRTGENSGWPAVDPLPAGPRGAGTGGSPGGHVVQQFWGHTEGRFHTEICLLLIVRRLPGTSLVCFFTCKRRATPTSKSSKD